MRALIHPRCWWAYACATLLPAAMVLWFSWRTSNSALGMYTNFDGIWAAWNLNSLAQWALPFDFSPFNPLSGLGSMFLPNLPWLNPGALVFLLPLHRDVTYVLSYGIYLVELTLSCLVLYRALGLGTTASVLATQLLILVLAPPWSGYFQALSWLSLAPVNAHLFAVCNAGLAALLALGRRGKGANVLLGLALAALALSAVYSAPVTIITYVPVYSFFALLAIWASRPTGKELAWKAGSVAIIAVLLWVGGMVEYLRATAAFSARSGGTPPFLWAGLEALKPGFWLSAFQQYDYCARSEILFCWKPRSLFFVHCLGLAGALVESLRKASPLRALAWGFLALIAALHVFDIGAVRALFGPLHVLSTPYHWWASYPMLFLFAGALLWRGASGALSRIEGIAFARLAVARAGPAALLAVPLLVPAVSYGLWKTAIEPHLQPRSGTEARGPLGRARIRTASEGAITAYLRSHASIAPGKPFRGYAATYFNAPEGNVARSQNRSGSGPRTVWTYIDAREDLDRRFGNMFQDMDLWQAGVPTLEEYGQWISKQAYHAYQLAFASPEDLLSPLILRIVRLDVEVLERFGVRFLITDAPIAVPGVQLRAKQFAPGFGEMLLYELASPNLAQGSVARFSPAPTMAKSIEALKGLQGDKRAAVVRPGEQPPQGVPHQRSELRFERDGFRLLAESAGRSYVVVPIQFSHCWKAVDAHGAPAPVGLQRADAILTMVRFEGRIDARFRLDFGPPSGSRCRLADANDYAELSGAPRH